MRILRVVTEGECEAAILEHLLKPHLGESLRVSVSPGGGAAPVSSARSKLADGLRVALVLNTGTLNFGKIRTRMARLENLMGMVAYRDRWKIVLFRPELEIVFFHEPELLRQLVGRAVTLEELERAQAHPKQVLTELLNVQPEDFLPELRRRLDSIDLRPLASHPQIRALLDFHAPLRPETWLISP
ncbi:hypothetical protein [Hyalangium rubrum]|uniref:DUF4276 family protein n=1 Tax=Hyalangium rubrum TaxID=3103134 RepID=A0ABU5HJ12_9BACT|nr:hypothetical protein [Hyalangium sp. s54d21]MDY7232075.1 hypothetical protein [Hyalangium sp. s54d21]